MVTTVTLNPCLDLTLTLGELKLGALNLVDSARTDVAGKGVNVAVVLRELGLEARCTGISFRGNGDIMDRFLEEKGIPYRFAMTEGEIRTNIKVVDASKGEMTELNSRGMAAGPEVVEAYLELLRQHLPDSGVLVLSGRIPNGAGEDIYRRSLELAAGLPVRTVVDAEGMPLRLALEARPTLIKPNAYELGHLAGGPLESRADMLEACREIVGKGLVGIICVSLGPEGAMIVNREEAWYAPALPVEAKGLQGAGDSMVAGLCAAMDRGEPLREMLAAGVAAASASVMREGTLLCRRADYDRLRGQVAAEPL